jgi:hypothetical protein
VLAPRVPWAKSTQKVVAASRHFSGREKAAARKNALSSRLGFGPHWQPAGGGRPASAARICRWRGAVLVASRVRGGKSLRCESLPRACASLSWLAAQQPSSPIGRVAAPACLSHRFARFTRCAAFRAVSQNPNPRGRRHPKKQTAPSSGATTGIHDFAAGPLSTRTPWPTYQKRCPNRWTPRASWAITTTRASGSARLPAQPLPPKVPKYYQCSPVHVGGIPDRTWNLASWKYISLGFGILTPRSTNP